MSDWQPISTTPHHIKQGDKFIARWKDALENWVYCIAYYGQFGDCFIWVPMGWMAGRENWVEEGGGVNGSGFAIGEPYIHPEEWCEIPE